MHAQLRDLDFQLVLHLVHYVDKSRFRDPVKDVVVQAAPYIWIIEELSLWNAEIED
jgi:hypothetical protein